LLFTKGKLQRSNYVLPPKGKGYAFILNIIEFDNEPGWFRKGASNDTHYMTKLWKGLGFKIFPEKSFRESPFKCMADIMRKLHEFKKLCIKDLVDCFVVFVGSHGWNNLILTSDHQLLHIYNDLIYSFQYSSNKRVARLFINQSCQNDAQSCVTYVGPQKPMTDVQEYVYVAAQMPSLEASRDELCGSYFVIVLTYVFMTKSWNTDLLNMLKEVIKVKHKKLLNTHAIIILLLPTVIT